MTGNDSAPAPVAPPFDPDNTGRHRCLSCGELCVDAFAMSYHFEKHIRDDDERPEFDMVEVDENGNIVGGR
jgi:hypothetical protein